jgi:hypothetical protein
MRLVDIYSHKVKKAEGWSWIARRLLKRIKQRSPIEVYIGGRLVLAGSGTISVPREGNTIITLKGLGR